MSTQATQGTPANEVNDQPQVQDNLKVQQAPKINAAEALKFTQEEKDQMACTISSLLLSGLSQKVTKEGIQNILEKAGYANKEQSIIDHTAHKMEPVNIRSKYIDGIKESNALDKSNLENLEEVSVKATFGGD